MPSRLAGAFILGFRPFRGENPDDPRPELRGTLASEPLSRLSGHPQTLPQHRAATSTAFEEFVGRCRRKALRSINLWRFRPHFRPCLGGLSGPCGLCSVPDHAGRRSGTRPGLTKAVYCPRVQQTCLLGWPERSSLDSLPAQHQTESTLQNSLRVFSSRS